MVGSLWTIQKLGLESYIAVSMGCLASAAFFQELPTVSNSSTGAKGSVCHCKFAADEAYSVMCVPVQSNDCRR